jgi:hypothetical protein
MDGCWDSGSILSFEWRLMKRFAAQAIETPQRIPTEALWPRAGYVPREDSVLFSSFWETSRCSLDPCIDKAITGTTSLLSQSPDLVNCSSDELTAFQSDVTCCENSKNTRRSDMVPEVNYHTRNRIDEVVAKYLHLLRLVLISKSCFQVGDLSCSRCVAYNGMAKRRPPFKCTISRNSHPSQASVVVC